jgi:hypothetical protein
MYITTTAPGGEDGGGFRHEMHAAEDDDPGVGFRGLLR